MDKLTKEQRSQNMAKVKSKNTKLELQVRKFLFSEGYRYRINSKITGKPDIVFLKKKIVIFVNGCFWHCHSCKKRQTLPKANADFWKDKLNNNKERDRRVKTELENQGFKVIYIWECDLKERLNETFDNLIEVIRYKH